VTSFSSKVTDKGTKGPNCHTLLTLGGHLPIFKHWAPDRHMVDISGGKV
jgi:hypothetical protein